MQGLNTNIKLYFLKDQLSVKAMQALLKGSLLKLQVIPSQQEKTLLEEHFGFTLDSLPCLVDGPTKIYQINKMVTYLDRRQGCVRKLLVYSLYDHLTFCRKIHLVKGTLEHSRSHLVISQHMIAVELSLRRVKGLFLRDNIRFDHIALFMAVKQFFKNNEG